MLEQRLERYDVPESVREFVLNVWLRHLRTAVLRDGEESGEFKVSLQVVDDLLWSLDRPKERQSRRQLAQKIPPLIRLLTQGLRAIGAKDEEFKPFFDELFLIHLRKMQRRARSGDNGAGGAIATATIGEPETTDFGTDHPNPRRASPQDSDRADVRGTARRPRAGRPRRAAGAGRRRSAIRRGRRGERRTEPQRSRARAPSASFWRCCPRWI